jgi:hypothetical protein
MISIIDISNLSLLTLEVVLIVSTQVQTEWMGRQEYKILTLKEVQLLLIAYPFGGIAAPAVWVHRYLHSDQAFSFFAPICMHNLI